MSLIVEFLGSMTKCLNSKKVLRSNCMSSNSDDGNANSASRVAIRNRLKMEKKLERLSNLTKKLLDDLEEQEDIDNNNNLGDYLYVHNFKHQDTDSDEVETTKVHNGAKFVRELMSTNPDNISLKECVVCLACPARIETMPCRHAVLCKRCFLRTIQTVIAQGTATLKCVLCRTKIIAINELEENPKRSAYQSPLTQPGLKQPARSTDPIKPKFTKLQGSFPTAPCRSAVSLFRRSSRVQDLSNGASSPTPTFHSSSSCQQVRRKQDRTYHLLASNNFEEQAT